MNEEEKRMQKFKQNLLQGKLKKKKKKEQEEEM